MSRRIVQLGVIAVAQAAPLLRVVARRADVLDVILLAVRLGTLAGTARVYERRGAAYWLSPTADLAATAALVPEHPDDDVTLAWPSISPTGSGRRRSGRTRPRSPPTTAGRET